MLFRHYRIIPLIVLMTDLKLINTLPGLLLVYSAVNVPFAVLLLTGFFRSLPQELEDAAAIDGASHAIRKQDGRWTVVTSKGLIVAR